MKYAGSAREHHKAVVLAVTHRFGPLSRVEMERLTGLRGNSISLLTRELLDEGRLVEAGCSDNPTGRKQILLRIKDDQGFLVGIEFDAESVIAAVMDLAPRILYQVRERTLLSGGVSALLRQLTGCVRAALSGAGVSDRPLLGVGIADPGLADGARGVSIMSSQIGFWKNVPLVKLFREEFGTSVLVENATRCKAVAERWAGAGERADDMIYVEYGAGIGAGIVSAGELLVGRSATAGEFGHTHVVDGGPACPCGSRGCLEAVAGSAALAAKCRKVLLDGGQSLALELVEGVPERLNGRAILQAAHLGDKTCMFIVEEMSRHLGLALANLVNLFNPSVIVLDPRLAEAGPGLFDSLWRIIRIQSLGHASSNLTMRFGKAGEQAGVLGVGLLMTQRQFEVPALKPPGFLVDPVVAARILPAKPRTGGA